GPSIPCGCDSFISRVEICRAQRSGRAEGQATTSIDKYLIGTGDKVSDRVMPQSADLQDEFVAAESTIERVSVSMSDERIVATKTIQRIDAGPAVEGIRVAITI